MPRGRTTARDRAASSPRAPRVSRHVSRAEERRRLLAVVPETVAARLPELAEAADLAVVDAQRAAAQLVARGHLREVSRLIAGGRETLYMRGRAA